MKNFLALGLIVLFTTMVVADEMGVPTDSTNKSNGRVCLLAVADTRLPMPTTRVPMPIITKGKGPQCVEPTDVMRRDHMKFLLQQRDATVREGIRTKKYSLTGCVACHVQRDAQGQAIPINAPGQFCEACHRYTAVRMDCFECHATTPDKRAAVQTRR
ncbi:MAG: hypothetical protein BMS9Abin14_344 [Gammaproteobacteria bacterium]|nr:MAG: hypothetical protein BMS9Abin14_344 [Gammaproteobacteria bacterium]